MVCGKLGNYFFTVLSLILINKDNVWYHYTSFFIFKFQAVSVYLTSIVSVAFLPSFLLAVPQLVSTKVVGTTTE